MCRNDMANVKRTSRMFRTEECFDGAVLLRRVTLKAHCNGTPDRCAATPHLPFSFVNTTKSGVRIKGSFFPV